MATIAYGIKKLGEIGTVQHEGGRYWVDYKGYRISFLANGEDKPDNSLTCEHTVRIGQEADPQSDYYPGSYWDSLTQAIRIVQQKDA